MITSENIEKIISSKTDFLLDLNLELIKSVLKMLRKEIKLSYTTCFVPLGEAENDFRYKITPKEESHFSSNEYRQVFDNGRGFVRGLSILDLIFNMGPEAVNYL